MAKDRKPQDTNAARGGSSRSGSAGSSRSGGTTRPGGAKGGRTRPATNVVTPQRPWGLIAAAIAVVVFAAAAITYAVVKVNEANANNVSSPDEIADLQTYDYAAGQEHVATPVTYEQTPPVGGPHDGEWADCTGTVYDVDIRHENAVHGMEHGAVWITYDPERITGDDVDTLAALVEGVDGRMLSPYAGQESPVSVQSWNHQLAVDSVDDERIEQFAEFFTKNPDYYPEVGATCQNPTFITDPLIAGDPSRGSEAMVSDPPSDPTGSTAPSAEATPSTPAEETATGTPAP
ncbi:DUF3105 domain-containing protein [Blastococcus sp. SYSU D00820]